MNPDVASLAATYRTSRHDEDLRKTLDSLSETYQLHREAALLDSVTAVGAAYSIFLADRLDHSAVDEQMAEALELVYPGRSIEWLAAMAPAYRLGALNGWKGKYFEVLVKDKLNAGESVGDLALLPGQEARLAASLTEPGWDLEIVNSSGAALDIFQLKASESLSYVQRALDRYPDIAVISTDDLGGLIAKTVPSGIFDSELEARLSEPFAALVDSPAVDLLEDVLPFLPFVLIAVGEGRHIICGRKSFARALNSSGVRSAKSGAAIGAGALVFALDGGWLSLPATALTRLAIGRYDNQSQALIALDVRYREAISLLSAYA